MFFQKTLRDHVHVTGIGLHSGKEATLRFLPAPPNTGVYFVRKDLPSKPELKVIAGNVQATSYATTLGGEIFSVSTIEHCMSTLSALRIDNLFVELSGPEIPIMDGSALHFLKAIEKVGLVEQDIPRNYCVITNSIEVVSGDKRARLDPYPGLRITAEIDFAHPQIGYQFIDLEINESTFQNEIAAARTFGFIKDVEQLRAKGLALGGSYDNAIVLSDDKILNPEGLRFKDEFVRHKVLDALGDLVTLGMPLMGHLSLFKAGHDLMNKLVRQVLSSSHCYRVSALQHMQPN